MSSPERPVNSTSEKKVYHRGIAQAVVQYDVPPGAGDVNARGAQAKFGPLALAYYAKLRAGLMAQGYTVLPDFAKQKPEQPTTSRALVAKSLKPLVTLIIYRASTFPGEKALLDPAARAL